MAKRYVIKNVLRAIGVICLPLLSQAQDSVAIIPRPVLLQQDTGYYHFEALSDIYALDDFKESADLLHDHPFIHFSEIKRIKSLHKIPKAGILLLTPDQGDKLADNAYRLQIDPVSIRITAHNREAMLNGILTLMQLAYTQPNPDSARVPCLLIEDAPRLSYRGVGLDVSHHFFPITFLKKFIDLMALYKFNTFYWHLTDAPGWRLEIKKYPELTQKAAWRTHVLWKDWWNEGRRYTEAYTPNASGGYYTQDEARELVAYAARKGVNVIPEIEFPGHSDEVLAVYPNLSSSGKPYQESTFNLANEETYTFIENVFTEVMDIFPSPFIAIGGKDVNAQDTLQSAAITRVAEFVKSKGRKPIGWNELPDGGLPAGQLNFDQYQSDPRKQPEATGGYLPIDSVYAFEPGAQANILSTYIPTTELLEYMVYPRALALAEVTWTAKDRRTYADFQKRLQQHYRLLQRWNVNYYRPSFDAAITAVYDPVKQANILQIQSEQYQSDIHYTIDGTDPTFHSPIYTDPFTLLATANVKAALFDDTVRVGNISELTADIHRGIGKKITYLNKWADGYAAGGETALLDGQKGSTLHNDAHWQGFLTDFDVSIDFERREDLESVSLRFMQNAGAGILIPASVSILLSDDGKNYREVQTLTSSIPATAGKLRFKNFTFNMEGKSKRGRYLRIIAKNKPGAFLFTDEVVIY
ncbi:hexosaminidase [bacterium A37T11]|nr:hexosaminidase [bacterium A37T11]